MAFLNLMYTLEPHYITEIWITVENNWIHEGYGWSCYIEVAVYFLWFDNKNNNDNIKYNT